MVMVPWLKEEGKELRPLPDSSNMNNRNVNTRESSGSNHARSLLSSEKYNSIKERLTASGTAPRSVSGLTRSSSSGEQFQRMTDVVRPPPGHPFLKSRIVSSPIQPQDLSSPPFLQPPTPLPPAHSDFTVTPLQFTVPPPSHPVPSQYYQPFPQSHSDLSNPKPPSLLSSLLGTPSPPKVLSTSDILSLILRLSSVRIPSEAKKSALLQVLKVPNITEPLVHQLLTMENGDLFGGLKCVLARYMECEAEDTAEVLELTLSFINKCLALQKASPRLRSLVVGKSRELSAVNSGKMSVLEQLVMVSKTRGNKTVMVDTRVCEEITEELRCVEAGRLLGTCYSAWDLQGEVASWVKLQLGLDMQTASSVLVRSLEEKYRVVDVSVVKEDMTEASLHTPILNKYPECFWPAVHTVRQDQAKPCVCLTVVQFLPTGHLLAYTDLDWQKGLAMLEQELQFSQTVMLQPGARDLQLGHIVTASRADMQLSFQPQHYQFTLARAVILSFSSENTVKLYLMDHGMEATIPINRLSSLPPTLKTLPPRLQLCRVQGITPTPSTKLVAQSIVTLAHLTNSATASALVLKTNLATPKTLCHLINSQQINLISPSLDILYVLASTQASLKHLVISNRNFPCVAVEHIIPTIFHMLSACLETLSLRTVNTALETIHCLLVALQPEPLRNVFSDVNIRSILVRVEKVHALGQYKAVLDKILDMDKGRGYGVNMKSTEANVSPKKISPSPVFKNTDIRERNKPQQPYNPHRIVTTDRPVFASADQLEQKHRRQTVNEFVSKGQAGHMEIPMADPDLERRKQERENLTADALKIFKQHNGTVEKQTKGSTNDEEVNADSQPKPVVVPIAETLTPPVSNHPQPSFPGISPDVKVPGIDGTAIQSGLSLPSWLGGDDSTSSCEEEDLEDNFVQGHLDAAVATSKVPMVPVTLPIALNHTEIKVPGNVVTAPTAGASLPSWLGCKDSKSSSGSGDESEEETHDDCLPPAAASSVKQLSMSISKLKVPFAAALHSSSSSSQEDECPAPEEKAAFTTLRGRYSPEEFGSGTESSREVGASKGQVDKEIKLTEVKKNKHMDKAENHTEQKEMDELKEEQQVLTRDFILSEKHSIGVELWDAERKTEVDNNRLAVFICGFLNSKAGGILYAGVRRNGLVRGIPLERKDRDNMRQMLDRVLASMINPRVPPNVVDIDFVAVEDKSRPSCPYRLIRVMVKGQRDGLNKVYMAHNLTSRSPVEEGAYVRKGHGPSFNTKLGHEEMLRLVDRR